MRPTAFRTVMLASALAVALFGPTGCGGSETATGDTGTKTKKGGFGDKHSKDRRDLGTEKIGGYTVKIYQLGPIKPATKPNEAIFEAHIPESEPDAKSLTLSCWFGNAQDTDRFTPVEGHQDLDSEAKLPGMVGFDLHVPTRPTAFREGGVLWVSVKDQAGAEKGKASFKYTTE